MDVADEAALEGTEMLLKMDFKWLLPENDNGVTIQIWHTTDDYCGPACSRVEKFMADVIQMAEFLGPDDAVTVEPHYLFVNCTNPGARRAMPPFSLSQPRKLYPTNTVFFLCDCSRMESLLFSVPRGRL